MTDRPFTPERSACGGDGGTGHPLPLRTFAIALTGLTLAVAFSFQGSRGLYDSTEGRYAESAREMAERGTYLEPTLNYRPHWSKPPVTYWAIIAGMELLGQNEWGVRLFNAVAFCLTVGLVVYLARVLWGGAVGIVAGFIYASSPVAVMGASVVSTDTLLTLFETAAVLCYVAARQSLSTNRWIVLMWLCFGLAFLTKGPPALLPLLAILIWNRWARTAVRLVSVSGVLGFAVLGFSWFAIVCARHEGLVQHLLGAELIGRFTADVYHNREWYKPITTYVPVLTLGAGPWLYHGLWLLHEKRLWSPRRIWRYVRRTDVFSFLFLWLAVALVAFSVVRSRLPLYVLPFYVPIASVVAWGIVRYAQKPLYAVVRRVAMVATVTGCLLIAGKGVGAVVRHHNNMWQLHQWCRETRSGPIVVTGLNQAKLYGLQFYLDGRLRRLSSPRLNAWADAIAAEEVKRLGRAGIGVPHIFICEDPDMAAPWLCARLREAGFEPEQIDGPYWVLCVIDPRS